uniref:3FTx-Aze-1 n=1 Tax=Azemiops feae TaxID=8773 RepID=M9T2J4_AZEFE|nr:3FTx-Aze-1 [Azemiops feae]
MKTLLLILGVVAFVYLDSGYSLICDACSKKFCFLTASEQCAEGVDRCYKKWNGTELFATKFQRGCAANCTTEEVNDNACYCKGDNCNK